MHKLIYVFIACACLALAGCATAPSVITTAKTDALGVDVAEKQTELAVTAKDVEANIDAIKVITDEAKTTGEIPMSIIKYVDTSASLVKKLNAQVGELTKLNTEYTKSRITDNADHAKALVEKDALISAWTARADVRLKWAAIATVVAAALAVLVFVLLRRR